MGNRWTGPLQARRHSLSRQFITREPSSYEPPICPVDGNRTRSFDRGSGTCSPSPSVVLELSPLHDAATAVPPTSCARQCQWAEVVWRSWAPALRQKAKSMAGPRWVSRSTCTWNLSTCATEKKRESASRSRRGHARSRCHFLTCPFLAHGRPKGKPRAPGEGHSGGPDQKAKESKAKHQQKASVKTITAVVRVARKTDLLAQSYRL
jgi:hypothetical protein